MVRAGLPACLVLLVAAGCGATAGRPRALPPLPPALAQRWAAQAQEVAAQLESGSGCSAQQLAQSLLADVAANRNRVPARFRTVLLTATANLSYRIACAPATEPPKHGPPPKPPHDHKGPKPPHGPEQKDGG